jgi:hypothetical protein
MDLVGPLPVATGQRKFLILAVDYFTKWVEAEPLATITDKKCWGFVWKSLICRFGLPRTIITDNGTQFCSSWFRDCCSNLGIEQRFTSVAHPQANGQTEVTNRTILRGLKRKVGAAKGLWVEELPNVLWAYRTSRREATGESPFALAFGVEAVTPVEVNIPSLRRQLFQAEENSDAVRKELDLLPEKRAAAAVHTLIYQQKMRRAFARKIRPRRFSAGDLVLRKMSVSDPKGAIGKMSPNWEGPYLIYEDLGNGAYHLQTIDGADIPRSWNAGNLLLYYP